MTMLCFAPLHNLVLGERRLLLDMLPLSGRNQTVKS